MGLFHLLQDLILVSYNSEAFLKILKMDGRYSFHILGGRICESLTKDSASTENPHEGNTLIRQISNAVYTTRIMAKLLRIPIHVFSIVHGQLNSLKIHSQHLRAELKAN